MARFTFVLAFLMIVPVLPAQYQRRAASRTASSRSASSQSTSRPWRRARPVAIKDITREMLRQRVEVEGTVAELVTKPSKTRERIYIYTLSQDDKTIDFVWWEDLARKLSPDHTPRKGQRVRIRGAVDEYNGNLQLRPGGPLDVEVLK